MLEKQSVARSLSNLLTANLLDKFVLELVETLRAEGNVAALSRRLGLRRNTFYDPFISPGLKEVLGALEGLGLRLWLQPGADSPIDIEGLNKLSLFATAARFAEEVSHQARAHFKVSDLAARAGIGRKFIYLPGKTVRFQPFMRLLLAMNTAPRIVPVV